jgi:hypothetical protein
LVSQQLPTALGPRRSRRFHEITRTLLTFWGWGSMTHATLTLAAAFTRLNSKESG